MQGRLRDPMSLIPANDECQHFLCTHMPSIEVLRVEVKVQSSGYANAKPCDSQSATRGLGQRSNPAKHPVSIVAYKLLWLTTTTMPHDKVVSSVIGQMTMGTAIYFWHAFLSAE